ncbi:MAG: tyrosine recombinase XerC [Planctomycetes bacterium]|nr:tyrosine recombinase XerC [Planctomycetota bacterium]
MKKSQGSRRGLVAAAGAEVELFLSLGVAEEGWSPRTRAAYAQDLNLYLLHLEGLGVPNLGSSRAETILDFLAWRRREGDAERTILRRLACLRSFHKYLLREGVLETEVLSRLPAPRRARNLPKFLSLDDMEALFTILEGASPLALRDRAIVELLYATGVRVSELCGLDEAGLGRGPLDSIKVLGKGRKERYLPLHPRAAAALEAWRRQGRPRLLRPEGCPSLFLSARGAPLGREAVYRRLRRLGLEAGLRQRLTPHLLRHTFATHLVHEGADLRSVQELLGHANLETTTIYTAVDGQRLREVHARHHPRG